MNGFPTSQSTPGANRPNQTEIMVASVLNAAAQDRQVRAALYTDAGALFAMSGFPIVPWHSSEFNQFVREQTNEYAMIEQIGVANGLENVQGIGCTVCKIASYTVAAVIVAVGVAGLSTLSVTSGAVLALAAFAGVEAATALAFIVSLGTAVGGGVSKVAEAICEWTGAC